MWDFMGTAFEFRLSAGFASQSGHVTEVGGLYALPTLEVIKS